MDNKHKIQTTTRDKLLYAWENSMQMIRNYETYSNEISDDPEVAAFFSESAVNEGLQASRFRELLQRYESVQG